MSSLKTIFVLSIMLSAEFTTELGVITPEFFSQQFEGRPGTTKPYGYERETESEFDIAHKYGVEPQLLRAIALIESNLDHKAINPDTLDFGIAQINYKTARGFGMDLDRLTKDRAYSIEMGAKVLSYFQTRYAKREPKTWVCRYNIGTARTLSPRQTTNCNAYLAKFRGAYGIQEI